MIVKTFLLYDIADFEQTLILSHIPTFLCLGKA